MTTHGFGAVEALRAVLPDAVVALFAVVTQLGDLWLFFLLLSLLYWFGEGLPGGGVDRRRAAFVVALALGAFALSTGLKLLFALPRPPGGGAGDLAGLFPAVIRPVYRSFATATGYGFPSGHAVGATIVWGGMALVVERWPPCRRYAAAVAVVALVGVSRVAIGVHHLSSVLAGVAVGAIYLAAAWRAAGGRFLRPGRAFVLAALVALAGVLLVERRGGPVGALGATVGATLAWFAVGGAVDRTPSRLEGAACAAVGLPVFGGLFAITYASEPAPAVAFVAYGVVVAGILALPLAVRPAVARLEGEQEEDAATTDRGQGRVG